MIRAMHLAVAVSAIKSYDRARAGLVGVIEVKDVIDMCAAATGKIDSVTLLA